nr:hypothetical protein GCM10017611_47190 [Rhodococcus wratislaviensis]
MRVSESEFGGRGTVDCPGVRADSLSRTVRPVPDDVSSLEDVSSLNDVRE